MKIRFLIYFVIFLLILNFSSDVFADELPEVPATPAMASVPSLPSIEAFGAPSPPNLLEGAEASMPSMPGVEFWQEKNEGQTTRSQPVKKPMTPTYAAIFAWPVRGKISSGFGPRGRSRHEGIDIPVPKGTPVQAAADGIVAEARTYRGYGHTVVIDHKNGTKTLYAHCSSLAVKKGESVVNGQVVAYAGSTGRSTASHVHFGVFAKGAFRDPVGYLKEPYQLAQK